jgi:hypothetical protein
MVSLRSIAAGQYKRCFKAHSCFGAAVLLENLSSGNDKDRPGHPIGLPGERAWCRATPRRRCGAYLCLVTPGFEPKVSSNAPSGVVEYLS